MKISAILMASGTSSRLGKDKAFLKINKINFIENILSLLIKSQIFEIKVVANSKIFNFLCEKKWNSKVQILQNIDNHLGQSSSIKIGVEACSSTDGYMFVALDQPFLTITTINQLINSFQKSKIIVPYFGDKTGLPTIFDREFKDELMGISGDIGGRDIIKKHSNVVKLIHIKSDKEGFDVDTRDDYELFKMILSSDMA